ncbi:MAG: ABC transporter permease [Acidobacteriota bacterium]
MDVLWRWTERLRRLLLPNRVEQEVADEMEHHLAMEIRERVAGGMEPAEARRTALIDFGGVERFRAEARDVRWGSGWDRLAQDTRYGLRTLRKNPGFAAVAMLTLALGIGASTAVFSLVNAVLMRPLPYGEPENALWIQTSWKGSPNASISPAEYLDYRDRLTDVFSAVGVYAFGALNLTGDGEPVRVKTAGLSAAALRALGVEPAIGRSFTESEDLAGAPVLLLSDALWRQRFAAAPDVVGKELTVNGRRREVIGVMPPNFRLPENLLTGSPAQVLTPLGIDPARVEDRGSHFLSGVARVRDGVTRQQAVAALEALAIAFGREHPDAYTPDEQFMATAIPLEDQVRGPIQGPMRLLMATVAFVLLVTCANVASLVLARADHRERELALRSALGAGRGRLARQMMVESLLLGLAGGLLGVLVAFAVTRGLVAWMPFDLPWLADVGINRRVLLFACMLSLSVGWLFGLFPALGASQARLMEALKEGAKTSQGSMRSQGTRRLLAVGEIALALVLLSGAGLLGRSFGRLIDVDPGFQIRDVATTRINLPQAGYPSNGEVTTFFRELIPRLEALPGVEIAGAVTNLPLATRLGDMNFVIEGRPLPERANPPAADWQTVTPGYFETLGLTLLRGRAIAASDVSASTGVVVINETFAATHWPGGDPLGRRLRLGGRGTQPEVAEVIGVVRDVRHDSLTQRRKPQMYFAHEQFRFWNSGRAATSMSLAVRSSLSLEELRAGVRDTIWSLDASLPLADFRTMSDVRRLSIAVPRFLMSMVASFAGVAFLLAAIGIYGVMAYTVSKRTAEFGIRLALGARPQDLARMILLQGVRLTALGLSIGLASSLVMSHAISDLLYDVHPNDPATLLGVSLLLAIAACVACWRPAHRASRVDPVELLRTE